MTPEKFCCSLCANDPPETLSDVQRALWYGARGDWKRAHELVQGETGANAAWIHAWLHRVEGDMDNARHWYGRAGRPEGSGPAENELSEIMVELLADID